MSASNVTEPPNLVDPSDDRMRLRGATEMPPPSTPLVGKRRPVKEVWVISPKGDSITLGSPQDRASKKEDRIMRNREFQYSTPNDSFDHNGDEHTVERDETGTSTKSTPFGAGLSTSLISAPPALEELLDDCSTVQLNDHLDKVND